MLAPVLWDPSHISIHDRSGLNEMANDIIEARMTHLYELFQMKYNEDLSRKEYIELFKAKFKDRKAYIYHYKTEVNIWNEFENGKVNRLTDEIIEKWVDRWIESKTMSEQLWYRKYYKELYERYDRLIKGAIKYLKEGKVLRSPYFEWLINTHLLGEAFPYDYIDE